MPRGEAFSCRQENDLNLFLRLRGETKGHGPWALEGYIIGGGIDLTREDGRAANELRPVTITTDFVKFAEGSCLIQCGDTMVLCCASVEEKTPPHVPYGEGWVTAEYSMLPRANRERSRRDVSKLKVSPRSAEIQRLVGRSLRSAVDMKKLGERTITVDCDVDRKSVV